MALENKRTIVIFYILAIAVSIGSVYYLNGRINQQQPQITMTYNAVTDQGFGEIKNTLSYPISLQYIYCTPPSGVKSEFSFSNGNYLTPGQDQSITLSVNSNTVRLTANCTGWKAIYST